jgi:fatty acid desaturase
MTPAGTAPTMLDGRPDGGYRELSQAVRDAGLLHRRYGYYAITVTLTLAAYAGAWVLFAALGDSWWQLGVAALLAVLFTHVSFFGHDAGHKQIFRSRGANDVTGYLMGALVGLSFGWWTGKHNRHHSNPNHEDDDPDLDIPILAFTDRQTRDRSAIYRWTAGHQAYLFFPLLLLEGFALHWAGIDAAVRGRLRLCALERALLAAHLIAYFGAVFVVLPWPKAIAFVAVHQCLWGLYMGCSFAPNHKGMATMGAGDTTEFLRRQVLTSRDVGGRAANAALGGLNYQIEHHLFPTMPRPNLRRAQPIVQAFCETHDISYERCSVIRSYSDVLRHLHAVGAPLRAPSRTR